MDYQVIDIESSRERREERDEDELDDLRAERDEERIRYHDKRKAPEMIARAALRSERTLTERVSMLERVQAEHDSA